MSPTLSRLESEALKLSSEERALLADHLLASLHADSSIDEAWDAEVERRVQAIDRGDESLVPLSEALERVRRTLA